jgi:hypothetical protein
MKKVLSSPLVSAANNIVSIGSASKRALPRFQRDFNDFNSFLQIKTIELERIKLPQKRKIKELANINLASSFGRPGGLLGGLFSGAFDIAQFLGDMFPSRGRMGKPQSNSGTKPPKPTVRGSRLKFGGLRSIGILNAVFAGVDFATGLKEGESVGKAAAGAGGALAGSLLGGAIGQALIPIPGLGFVIGSAAGGFLGGWGADRITEVATGGKGGTSEKLSEKLKSEEQKQKTLVQQTAFSNVVEQFDAAVSKFEKGVAQGLFGSIAQNEIGQDVAQDDYAETNEDQLLDQQSSDQQSGDKQDYGSIGGTFESHVKEFREFRNKQFGASKERFATPNPQNYQIRELGIWEGGKQDNWKINPLADDTAYEKNAHKGAGHWENRAFDIPVPIKSKQGDMVAEFWRRKGYRVIWKTDKAHENHVHVEVPKEKANDFFAGKIKPEQQKTGISKDSSMMEGNVDLSKDQKSKIEPKQQLGTQQVPFMGNQAFALTAPQQPQYIPPQVQADVQNTQKIKEIPQYYPSYNQQVASTTVMPILMGSQGGQQKPVVIPVGGGGQGSTIIIPPPSQGDIVNSLMKTFLLTNLSAT